MGSDQSSWAALCGRISQKVTTGQEILWLVASCTFPRGVPVCPWVMTRVMMWPTRLYFRLRVMASQETPSKSKKISLRLADPPSREEVGGHTHSTMERPDMLRLKKD